MPRPHTLRPTHQGFSLLEVLVAIVIFSLGLLGMVGMHAFALQANREARLQSQAVGLARELAEMMRSNNLVATSTGSNPYLFVSTADNLTASPSNLCLTPSQSGAGCSNTAAVGNSHMTDWLARVQDTLPEARVAVCRDSAPYDSTGRPVWSCSNSGDVLMIKLGWIQNSIERGQSGSNAMQSSYASTARPIIIVPVTAGQPT